MVESDDLGGGLSITFLANDLALSLETACFNIVKTFTRQHDCQVINSQSSKAESKHEYVAR